MYNEENDDINENTNNSVIYDISSQPNTVKSVYIKTSSVATIVKTKPFIYKMYTMKKFAYCIFDILVHIQFSNTVLLNVNYEEINIKMPRLLVFQNISFGMNNDDIHDNINDVNINDVNINNINNVNTPLDYSQSISEKNLFQLLHDILLDLCNLKLSCIIHTDIRPDNILHYYDINHNIRFKLNDFSHAILHNKRNIHPTNVSNAAYRAPEIFKLLINKYVIYDYQIDVWSFVLTVLEIIFDKKFIYQINDKYTEKVNKYILENSYMSQKIENLEFENTKKYEEYKYFYNIISEEIIEDIKINMYNSCYKHKIFLTTLFIRMLSIDPNVRITCNTALLDVETYTSNNVNIAINTELRYQYSINSYKLGKKDSFNILFSDKKYLIDIVNTTNYIEDQHVIQFLELMTFHLIQDIINKHEYGFHFIEILFNIMILYNPLIIDDYFIDVLQKIMQTDFVNILYIIQNITMIFNNIDLDRNKITQILQLYHIKRK